MSFATALDSYCKMLDCTGKVVAAQCGLSPSTLSRYLSGNRVPNANSENIDKLADGLAALSRKSGMSEPLDAVQVRTALAAEIVGTQMVGMDFHMRLDTLMDLIGVRNADIAEVTGTDPSYVSRIRRGQRTPSNLPSFAASSAHVAAHFCIERNMLEDLGGLVGMPDIIEGYLEWNPNEESNIAEIIEVWLMGNQIVQADMAKLDELLTWLDEEDFSSWLSMSNAKLDETPEQPDSIARFYYGVDGMRSAEIDFLNMAFTTRSRNLWLSTDAPLMTIPPGPQFSKRYRRALVKLLETGCRIKVFHAIEQPLEETIQSLYQWVPLYITGQVDPYYLRGVNNRLFFHMNYVSDSCALSSEAVIDHEEDGRYYFTTRPKDVEYYQRKIGFILEKASTLFETYRSCDPGQQEAFEKAEAKRRATGRGYQMSESRFNNLEITVYPGDCTVIMLPCGPTTVHFVLRHPKLNYIISHMK